MSVAQYQYSITVYPEDHNVVAFRMTNIATECITQMWMESWDGIPAQIVCKDRTIPDEIKRYRDAVREYVDFTDATFIGSTFNAVSCGSDGENTRFELIRRDQSAWYTCTVDNATGRILDSARPEGPPLMVGLRVHDQDPVSQRNAMLSMPFGVVAKIIFSRRLTLTVGIEPWLDYFNETFTF